MEAEGFKFEKHTVTTEDGYILEMHRLNMPGSEDRPVVMLQHGILSSSETWVLNGEDSTAFKLAYAGYDVWMGNNRGSMYSMKHESLDPTSVLDEAKFFDYSFFELGQYDIPA